MLTVMRLLFDLSLENSTSGDKSTSNICSNETLIALMGAMHMALLGQEGLEKRLRNLAMRC